MAEGEVSKAPVVPEADTEHCAVCSSAENLKRCGKCLSVAYCCKEHQIQDWKKHKKNCIKKGNVGKSEENQVTKPETLTTHENEENSAKSASLNLSFEFDKRPIKIVDFVQPAAGDKHDPDVLAAHVTKQLKLENYCVVNDIFNPKLANAILNEVKNLHSTGIFIDGQLSGGKTSSIASQTEKAIRGDKITWLEGNEKQFPYICLLVKTLDNMVSRMNYHLKGECEVGGRTKAMVACYPGNGSGYACHVDNPNRDGRCITCLYYLNEGWDASANGGMLRLFQGTDDYVDVEPILNRAIFFWSDRRNPHEVQPAFKKRYAITLWYLDRHERQQAKNSVKAQTIEDMNKMQQQYAMMDLESQETKEGELEK